MIHVQTRRMEQSKYRPTTLALRSARSMARGRSLTKDGKYLIDPPMVDALDVSRGLTKIMVANNGGAYALFWYFLNYTKDGTPISSQNLLECLEGPDSQLSHSGWLEVGAGGIAHLTHGGMMFLPLGSAMCQFTPPYGLSLSGTNNGHGNRGRRERMIEYCPTHIGLPSKDDNIGKILKPFKVKQREFSGRELFLDILDEINTTAEPGLAVPAARARRLTIGANNTLIVDEFHARLRDGRWEAD
jgi:hypothetical protein